MILFLVLLTAVVYGILTKYVLKNVFVTKSKTVLTARAIASEDSDSRDLVPAYDR
ncbi:hypothetical protein ACOJQI_14590 [Bacillus salacetis]|uniref:hypothetical protein n=1 Tax=Bacillus salacetis TaxID=2315464 RepID=UPI003BA0E54B